MITTAILYIHYVFSLAKTDSQVATASMEEANEEIQRALEAKKWKKAEEGSSKLKMAVAASKRSSDTLDKLEVKRKKLQQK